MFFCGSIASWLPFFIPRGAFSTSGTLLLPLPGFLPPQCVVAAATLTPLLGLHRALDSCLALLVADIYSFRSRIFIYTPTPRGPQTAPGC